MFVPVVDRNNKPLMPTKPSRARRWVQSEFTDASRLTGKATPFWKKGIFCVRLNISPSAKNTQPIAFGIDPGSKKEAFTVKSAAHTYLNIQASAVDWVSEAVKTRREMRRGRRFRKTPCRKPRFNRSRGGILPSTKARWQCSSCFDKRFRVGVETRQKWKLRLCWWLKQIFPITDWVVENIQALTKQGKRKWNASFSPLEVGKCYAELEKLGRVSLVPGYYTKRLRDNLGLKKSSNKLSDNFSAHCVDSWVLANFRVGGHTKPDNESMLLVTPLRFHRRQLYALQPTKGGIRRPYGGTRSEGFKRGSYMNKNLSHDSLSQTFVKSLIKKGRGWLICGWSWDRRMSDVWYNIESIANCQK